MSDGTGVEPPFTEDELKAAAAQMRVRDATAAISGFFTSLRQAAEKELIRLRRVRLDHADAAARRQARINAAEVYLRRQHRPSGK